MVLKNGMLEKFVSKTEININKGKGKTKKDRITPQKLCVSKKGLMDKKHRQKMEL